MSIWVPVSKKEVEQKSENRQKRQDWILVVVRIRLRYAHQDDCANIVGAQLKEVSTKTSVVIEDRIMNKSHSCLRNCHLSKKTTAPLAPKYTKIISGFRFKRLTKLASFINEYIKVLARLVRSCQKALLTPPKWIQRTVKTLSTPNSYHAKSGELPTG